MQRVLFGANIPHAGSDYQLVERAGLSCEKYGFDFV